MNKFPALLLRSPAPPHKQERFAHHLHGAQERQKDTTPITYLRDGDTVLMTTDNPWWKNLRGGALVTLRIRGREYIGVAEAVTNEAEVARVLQMMLKEYPGYGKYVGLHPNPEGQI